MSYPTLEVADIFCATAQYGDARRRSRSPSLGKLKVTSAMQKWRSGAWGHALHCSGWPQIEAAYNSCRNRHRSKCQGIAARPWLEARQAELVPVEYYHVVFTLPAAGSAIAWYNKPVCLRLSALKKYASQRIYSQTVENGVCDHFDMSCFDAALGVTYPCSNRL